MRQQERQFKMKSMFKGALGALMVVLALGALTATSALAAGAPVAETKPVSAVTETSAMLWGKVNPNGVTTKYYFEYGPTPSYGSKTAEGSTKIETKASKTIEGLTRGTTYHFRLVATNEYGTSYGADEAFSTIAEKPEAVVIGSRIKISELKIKGSGGGPDLEWGGQKSIGCLSSEFSGHFINAKELEGTMRWSECFGADRQVECWNEKEYREGKYVSSWIQSEPLKGTLGYINKAKQEVGVRLKGVSSETWANKVSCPGGTNALTGSLGGQLVLPVNTIIKTTGSFSLAYTEKEDKQITGELGGQLLWPNSNWPFGISGSLTLRANEAFEIQA
jgi:hypothetical protein